MGNFEQSLERQIGNRDVVEKKKTNKLRKRIPAEEMHRLSSTDILLGHRC